MSIPARMIRRLVVLYQQVRAGRPSPCRFQPSCSSYAVEALEVHGALRGSWLAIRRLSRCHPWGGQGWDPVPEAADRHHGRSHDHHHERTVV
jgi:putative membrane protein insertion efficiency factor